MKLDSGFTFHKIQSILMTSAVNHAYVIKDTRVAVEKSCVISSFLARNLYPHHQEHVVQLVLVITETSSTKMARAGSSDNPTWDPIVTSAHAHLIKQSVWRWDVQTFAQILFMSLTNAALLAIPALPHPMLLSLYLKLRPGPLR